jgi:transcriptional regulator with XRE-family HTH domain
LRDRAGISQQKLAERAGLSISEVVMMEGGRRDDPKLSTLRALAGALDMDVADLVKGLDEPPPKQKGGAK